MVLDNKFVGFFSPTTSVPLLPIALFPFLFFIALRCAGHSLATLACLWWLFFSSLLGCHIDETMGVASDIPRRHWLTGNLMILWFEQSLNPSSTLFLVSVGTGLHGSAFSLVVVFFNGFCLLKKTFP